MIIDNGKTNQMSRAEYGAVMGHRNPLLCTMAHKAFYRWNITGEPPPSFRRREQWYQLHLLKASMRRRRWRTTRSSTGSTRCSPGANVTSLKKTHAGRSQGAKHAELNGTPEGQILRAGRWNNDALTNYYLTHLPRKVMRSIAGFSPSMQGNFYLPRAEVLPPRSLEAGRLALRRRVAGVVRLERGGRHSYGRR